MRISGKWFLSTSGVLEPILFAAVESPSGDWIEEAFLVDSGAEQSVLSVKLLRDLGAPTRPSMNHLSGIGGVTAFSSSQLGCDSSEMTDFTRSSTVRSSVFRKGVKENSPFLAATCSATSR